VSRKHIDPDLAAKRERAVNSWERNTALPLAILAIGFLALWAVQVLAPVTEVEWNLLEGAILSIWVIFIGDFLVRLYYHQDRKNFLRSNVVEIIALLVPALRFLRMLRVLMAVGMLTRVVQSLQARVNLYIAIVLPMLVFAGALGVYEAERSVSGSNLTNFPDSFWWAWETVFTVGYGDHFPVSAEGRFIAVILMLGGVAMISVVTANLASYFLSQQRNLRK
jgi:voltage-gated potassium channel